jgi:DnaJ-domain-containing protein 1
MSADLVRIHELLLALEEALRLDDEQGYIALSDQLAQNIKEYFEPENLTVTNEDMSELESLLSKINVLNNRISEQKSDVAARLREHVGNKKKISAYKGNNPNW